MSTSGQARTRTVFRFVLDVWIILLHKQVLQLDFCGLFMTWSVDYQDYIASNGGMIGDLGSIWKEVVVA